MGAAGRVLATLVEELAREVKDIGARPTTVETYRSVCNGFLGFAHVRGETTWSEELASAYIAHIDGRLGQGNMSRAYHRFQRRVLRMLSSIAEDGEADFSRAHGRSVKYPVSDAACAVVEEILAAKCRSEGTRLVLRPTVRHLLWYAAERHLGPFEVDDSLVMEFLVSEVPATNAGSVGRALRAVSYATEWLREHGGRVLRDYSMLTLRGGGRKMIPAFTEAEVRSIVGAIDASTDKGKRDRAVVLLAYCTGLRSRDILSLKLEEVDWRRQRITTNQSKSHKPITCELNGETMNALADYVLEARPECRLREVFLTVRAPHRAIAADQVSCWFDGLCDRAGVEKVPGRSFHSLRRSFETVLVSRGVEIETVSHMVGHSSIDEDKPYITYDSTRSALVAMGFSDVPVRVGAYASDGEVMPHERRDA